VVVALDEPGVPVVSIPARPPRVARTANMRIAPNRVVLEVAFVFMMGFSIWELAAAPTRVGG
jgi:hypothetical protein